MEPLTAALHYGLIGLGATLVMDIWAITLRVFLGVPSLDYALVGRWLLHMRKAQWAHNTIIQAPPMRGERLLGWGMHYAIGLLFALGFGAAQGAAWLLQPDLPDALLMGALTLVFPFLVMQPAFGFGIAARKTPNPSAARGKSVLTHLVFGAGLWLSAEGLNLLQ